MKKKSKKNAAVKPEGSRGIAKPLVYGPRVNSGTSVKKTEPKKP